MQYRWLLAICAVFVSITSSGFAQEDDRSWEYILGNMNGGPLYSITSDGITDLTLPEGSNPAYNTRLFEVFSEDNSLGAFTGNIYGGNTVFDILIANFADDTCCLELAEPFDPTSGDVYAFSSTNTRVVGQLTAPFDSDEESILAVWDTATGEIVASQPTSTIPGFPGNIREFDESILIYDDAFGEQEIVWDLVTNTVDAVDIDISEQACTTAQLATDESVFPAWDDNYETLEEPFENSAGQLVAPANVVQYDADACDDSDDPVTIYHDPQRLYIVDATWVLDGEAILIRHADSTDPQTQVISEEAVLLYRDGTIQTVTVPSTVPRLRVFGTPTGWFYAESLPTDEEFVRDGRFANVLLDGDDVITVELGTRDNVIINAVLREPLIGTSLDVDTAIAFPIYDAETTE